MVMDGTLHVTTMLPLLVPLVLYFMLQHYLRFTYDPMEPPVVPQKFPFVGHIFGLIRHRLRYFELIRYRDSYSASSLGTDTTSIVQSIHYPSIHWRC